MKAGKNKLLQKYNQAILDDYLNLGGINMGPYASYTWRRDSKHLFFSMARYKFCAKLLAGKKNILEIGCGDASCMNTLLQEVQKIHGIDIEPLIIEINKKLTEYPKRCSFEALDIVKEIPLGKYDGAVCLDVIEHIKPNQEKAFTKNIVKALNKDAILIMGTPNITAKKYASPKSKAGHINLKNHRTLRDLLKKHFNNVLIFSMNDEIIHTGFAPLAHYLIGVGCYKK